MDWCCDMFPFQKIQKTLTGNTDNPTTDQFGIPSSKRCKATTMFESCSSSLTSLEMTPPTVATTRAPQIPESIQNTSPKLQQVAGIDNSIGLFPDPEPILTPQKTRIVPTIVEQRFDGKVYVRMPNMQNPGTDWMTEGWLTGKKGAMERLLQVKLSNGDTINALPMGETPLTMKIKQEPYCKTEPSPSDEEQFVEHFRETEPKQATRSHQTSHPNQPHQHNQPTKPNQPQSTALTNQTNQPNEPPKPTPPTNQTKPTPPTNQINLLQQTNKLDQSTETIYIYIYIYSGDDYTTDGRTSNKMSIVDRST